MTKEKVYDSPTQECSEPAGVDRSMDLTDWIKLRKATAIAQMKEAQGRFEELELIEEQLDL